MTACLCPACTDTPAPTYTDEFRHACELAHVAALPSREARGRYLFGMEARRREILIDGLRAIAEERAAA